MADLKISQLTAITTLTPATDVLPVVDVTGTTKKITSNQILGSGGTATLASATITGDLTASSDVLVNGNEKYVYLSSNYSIGNNSRVRFRAVGAGGGSGYGGDFRISTRKSDNNWNTDALTVDSTGNVSIANGNLVMSTSGKGIDFSATTEGSGTMTSELLNDYEEGTFTPTVIGATTAGVGVYTTQVGRYTKIGNLVTVQVYLGWSAHTGTGNMRFGNFPFNTSSDSGSNNGVSFGYVNNIALSASNVLTGLTGIGNSYVDAYQYPVGGGASTAVPIDTAGDVIFTASYRV